MGKLFFASSIFLLTYCFFLIKIKRKTIFESEMTRRNQKKPLRNKKFKICAECGKEYYGCLMGFTFKDESGHKVEQVKNIKVCNQCLVPIVSNPLVTCFETGV